MKSIQNIDLEKVKEIASEYGTIKAISERLHINKSILRRALYYNFSISNSELREDYIKLAKAIRDGQYIYNKNKLE